MPTITIEQLQGLNPSRKDAEPRLRALLDAAVDSIITIDQHGIIESVNPATERMFGYTASELLGCNVSMLMPSPHRERHDNYMSHYLMTGERRIIGIGREVEAQRRDGSVFPVDLAVTEFEVGGQRMFTGLVRDITDRRAAERVAQGRLDELAHAGRLADLGLTTSTIAHEINQPLTAIVSFAHACQRILDSDQPDRDTLREALGRIAEQGERASAVVSRVRDMASKRKHDPNPLDMNVAVRAVLDMLAGPLRSRLVSVECHLDDALPEVHADRVQMEQIIMNLVTNAMEAMAESPTHARRVEVSTRAAEREVILCVRDNGPGIDDAQLEKIFANFYTTKPNGMGMGLSICRGLAEAHGGRLWATRADGGGAMFHLAMPMAD